MSCLNTTALYILFFKIGGKNGQKSWLFHNSMILATFDPLYQHKLQIFWLIIIILLSTSNSVFICCQFCLNRIKFILGAKYGPYHTLSFAFYENKITPELYAIIDRCLYNTKHVATFIVYRYKEQFSWNIECELIIILL
jgi:hypothetical protein